MIIARYLLKEMSVSIITVIGILLVIFVSKHFVRYMSDAAAGELPTYLIIKLLSLFTLASLVMMIPLALYIAVLITMGRMYKDSEMTVLQACGYGIERIMRIVLVLALVLATIVGVISLWVAPWAERQQYNIRDQAAVEAEFSFLEPGRFHEIRNSQGVFYIERLSNDKRQMENVFVFLERGDKVDVFSARTGRQTIDPVTGYRYLILEDGFRYEILGEEAGYGYRVHEYQESGIRLAQAATIAKERPRIAWSTEDLLAQGEVLENAAEFQWRLAMPISVVLLALLGVLLSRTDHRQGRFGQLFGALILYVVYIYLLMLSRSWIKNDVLPPVIGLWWVHLLILLGIITIYIRQNGFYWWLKKKTKPVSFVHENN